MDWPMDLTVEEMGSSAIEPWTEILASCGGNPLHVPAVSLVEYSEEDIHYLVLRAQGDVIGCAVGGTRTERRWRFGRGRRVLALSSPPATKVEAERLATGAVKSLVEYARRAGYSHLRIGNRWGWDRGQFPSPGLQSIGASIEFCMSLDQSWEELLARMEKTHRKNVRRSVSSSVEVIADSSFQALMSLRDLQVISADRAAKRGAAFAVQSQRYFEGAHRTLYEQGPARILLARQGDSTIAGLAYLATDSKALTIRSGANSQGYEQNAMYALHGVLFQQLQAAGIREVNLGSVPAGAHEPDHPQHGLYMFKRGFGGTERISHSVCYATDGEGCNS